MICHCCDSDQPSTKARTFPILAQVIDLSKAQLFLCDNCFNQIESFPDDLSEKILIEIQQIRLKYKKDFL